MTRQIVRDWMLEHVFKDDCDYPLISASDVVLEDLEYRLTLAEKNQHPDDIRRLAKARYDAIPWTKGKEKKLRRPCADKS